MINSFKESPKAIRKRLLDILDDQLNLISEEAKRQGLSQCSLNELFLTDYIKAIHSCVQYTNQPIAVTNSRPSPSQVNLSQRVNLPIPKDANKNKDKCLLNIDANTIEIYKLNESDKLVKIDELIFDRGSVRKFSSYNFYDESNVIIVGGCREHDNNLKAKSIFKLELSTRNIIKIAELPEGISSHSTVIIKQNLYIIGGYKNHNVVSKQCYSLELGNWKLSKIADMEYPSASHSCVEWQDRYLYKIGGIGDCFGQWDLSPYIERYDTMTGVWTLINPIIGVASLGDYALLAHSLVYVSEEDELVVCGGFRLDKAAHNAACVVKIDQNEVDPNKNSFEIVDKMDSHVITAIVFPESLKPGGFWSNHLLSTDRSLHALQVQKNESGQWLTRPINVIYKFK